MKNIKYNSFVTKDKIDDIVRERYPDNKCPKCGKTGVYGGCIEDQFDEKKDEYVVLSFTVFCKECGDVLGKWDNTNRNYLFGKRV